MKEIARKNIREIVPYEPGKPIEEVERELGIKGIVKLASNENPLGPSPKAIKAIKECLKDLNRYPDGGSFYLKERLAGEFGLDKKNLILGNGSNEIIELAIRAFMNEGEEALTAEPSFLIYKISVKIEGGNPVLVPLKDYTYDLPRMKEAVTERTKLVFIANPNNPTGTSVGKDELEKFLDGLPKGVIVILDEAYNEFVERRDFPNSLDYLNRGNVIILRTFSKAHGLPGLRIGFGISSPELIDLMDRTRQPFNVNSLAQAAALASLGDKAHVERIKKLVKEGKECLYGEFDSLGLFYLKSDTNFILVDIKGDGKEVFEKMLREGVIVRDMNAYGLKSFIRVTIGTKKENKKFINALKKVLIT